MMEGVCDGAGLVLSTRMLKIHVLCKSEDEIVPSIDASDGKKDV